jgi:glucose-1-phosphate thymidylyltransferase
MRGIVLAGGTGSRLWPITKVISKQLLPIHSKPLIYYPISTLMLAGIRDILVITTPTDHEVFKQLLGDGSRFGINLEYKVQPHPAGLAEAFLIGEQFIGGENVALILGDNIFHGTGLGPQLRFSALTKGAKLFGVKVKDPSSYGVLETDSAGRIVSIEEKPIKPKSNYAIPGLYFYDNKVVEIAKNIKPSDRGELEITSINKVYLELQELSYSILPRGTAWFDAGSVESLFAATTYVRAIEEREGVMIACLEEVAWRNGWISTPELQRSANELRSNQYSQYLQSLLNENGN